MFENWSNTTVPPCLRALKSPQDNAEKQQERYSVRQQGCLISNVNIFVF